MNKSDTIAAIATGMVSSGIGIVRVSGADALSIASLIFKPKYKSNIKVKRRSISALNSYINIY